MTLLEATRLGVPIVARSIPSLDSLGFPPALTTPEKVAAEVLATMGDPHTEIDLPGRAVGHQSGPSAPRGLHDGASTLTAASQASGQATDLVRARGGDQTVVPVSLQPLLVHGVALPSDHPSVDPAPSATTPSHSFAALIDSGAKSSYTNSFGATSNVA